MLIGTADGAILVTSEGARHPSATTSFRPADKTGNGWRGMQHKARTVDGTFISHEFSVESTSNVAIGKAVLSDGTICQFRNEAITQSGIATVRSITDRNGNTIKISPVAEGPVAPAHVILATGTMVEFHYNRGHQRLQTITAPNEHGAPTEILRISYGEIQVAGHFKNQPAIGFSTLVPTRVFDPATGKGYSFAYNSYGLITQVNLHRGMRSTIAASTDEDAPIDDGTVTESATYTIPITPGVDIKPQYPTQMKHWILGAERDRILELRYREDTQTKTNVFSVIDKAGPCVETTSSAEDGWKNGCLLSIKRTLPDGTPTSSEQYSWEEGDWGSPRQSQISITEQRQGRKQERWINLSYGAFNRVTEERHYHAGAGETRRRSYTYEESAAYTDIGLIGLIREIVETDSRQSQVSQELRFYDESPLEAHPHLNLVELGLEPRGHNRGNCTRTIRFSDPEQNAGASETRYRYYVTGNTFQVEAEGEPVITSIYDDTSKGNFLAMEVLGDFPFSQSNSVCRQYTFESQWGLLKSLVDEDGIETTYRHDSAGRVRTQTRSGFTIQKDYVDAEGWETETHIVNRLPVLEKTTIRGGAELVLRTTARDLTDGTAGIVQQRFTYDEFARLSGSTPPHFQGDDPSWDTLSYDLQGRVTSSRIGGSSPFTTTYSYDAEPWPVQLPVPNWFSTLTIRGSDGSWRWLASGVAGQPLYEGRPPNVGGSVLGPETFFTAFETDGDARITRVSLLVDGQTVNVRRAKYDGLGRLSASVTLGRERRLDLQGAWFGNESPDLWSDFFEWEGSRLKRHTDPKGVTRVNEYEKSGLRRLTSTWYNSYKRKGASTRYRMVAAPPVAYEYSPNYPLKLATIRVNNWPSRSFVHNPADRSVTETFRSLAFGRGPGVQRTIARDERGLLSRASWEILGVTGLQPRVQWVQYDGFGRMKDVRVGSSDINNTDVAWISGINYSPRNEAMRLEYRTPQGDLLAAETFRESSAASGAVLKSHDLTDAAGTVLESNQFTIERRLDGLKLIRSIGGIDLSREFTYNAWNQLSHVSTTTDGVPVDTTYSYNLVGVRAGVTSVGPSGTVASEDGLSLPLGPIDFRIPTVGYDEAGNVAEMDGPDGRRELIYDQMGRLAGIDHLGTRDPVRYYDYDTGSIPSKISFREDALFIVSFDGQAHSVIAGGDLSSLVANARTYFDGIGLAQMSEDSSPAGPSTAFTWFRERGLGYSTGVGPAGERLIARRTPFGIHPDKQTFSAPGDDAYFLDPDGLLDGIGVRGYLPQYGRFASLDPLVWATAPNATHVDAYAYCNHDPVNRRDPSGLEDSAEINPPQSKIPEPSINPLETVVVGKRDRFYPPPPIFGGGSGGPRLSSSRTGDFEWSYKWKDYARDRSGGVKYVGVAGALQALVGAGLSLAIGWDSSGNLALLVTANLRLGLDVNTSVGVFVGVNIDASSVNSLQGGSFSIDLDFPMGPVGISMSMGTSMGDGRPIGPQFSFGLGLGFAAGITGIAGYTWVVPIPR